VDFGKTFRSKLQLSLNFIRNKIDIQFKLNLKFVVFTIIF